MKDQYFGDAGDFGKYGLLRFLAQRGVFIAVNWYLTPNDDSNDGNKRSYLIQDRFRVCDPELYDVLRDMDARFERSVARFAARGMIPGAVYFDKYVKPDYEVSALSVADKKAARQDWHREALAACAGSDLVFLDPDIGFRAGRPSAGRDARKYVYAAEVCDYYDRGQDIVYYCHRGRRADAQWETDKNIMLDYRSDAALMGVTYHRGTQRSYLFIVHPEREARYRALLKRFLETPWRDHFTEEGYT